MSDRITAIIPARGGSKGIPNKNIILVNGIPLIFYSIDECLKSEYIDNVVVSTDSKTIRNLVLDKYNSVDVIMRPSELSLDTSVSEAAILHALENIEPLPDITVFVQATSPLTEFYDFDLLIGLVKNGYDSAAFYVEDFGFFFGEDHMESARMPRQYRPPRKRESGNAWAFKTDGFIENETRLFGKVGLQKIDNYKHFEVDGYDDLKIVSYLLKDREFNNLKDKIIVVDLDGTLCELSKNTNYENVKYDSDLISKINELYKNNTIIIWTARGTTTGVDSSELTKIQLATHGVKYDYLKFGKPHYHYFIDDKSLMPNSLRTV